MTVDSVVRAFRDVSRVFPHHVELVGERIDRDLWWCKGGGNGLLKRAGNSTAVVRCRSAKLRDTMDKTCSDHWGVFNSRSAAHRKNVAKGTQYRIIPGTNVREFMCLNPQLTAEPRVRESYGRVRVSHVHPENSHQYTASLPCRQTVSTHSKLRIHRRNGLVVPTVMVWQSRSITCHISYLVLSREGLEGACHESLGEEEDGEREARRLAPLEPAPHEDHPAARVTPPKCVVVLEHEFGASEQSTKKASDLFSVSSTRRSQTRWYGVFEETSRERHRFYPAHVFSERAREEPCYI